MHHKQNRRTFFKSAAAPVIGGLVGAWLLANRSMGLTPQVKDGTQGIFGLMSGTAMVDILPGHTGSIEVSMYRGKDNHYRNKIAYFGHGFVDMERDVRETEVSLGTFTAKNCLGVKIPVGANVMMGTRPETSQRVVVGMSCE